MPATPPSPRMPQPVFKPYPAPEASPAAKPCVLIVEDSYMLLELLVTLCEQHGDFVSREILRVQLQDTEEDHAHWLEQQLGLIRRLGIENYLTARLAEKPASE